MQCPAGTVRNPRTYRCVKVTRPLGAAIQAAARVLAANGSLSACEDPSKEFDPHIGRCTDDRPRVLALREVKRLARNEAATARTLASAIAATAVSKATRRNSHDALVSEVARLQRELEECRRAAYKPAAAAARPPANNMNNAMAKLNLALSRLQQEASGFLPVRRNPRPGPAPAPRVNNNNNYVVMPIPKLAPRPVNAVPPPLPRAAAPAPAPARKPITRSYTRNRAPSKPVTRANTAANRRRQLNQTERERIEALRAKQAGRNEALKRTLAARQKSQVRAWR
jgi:hypothetical protein